MSLGYGDVARVGHLYPSGGLADYELQLMAPDGIQFVTTRLPFRRTGLDDDRHLFDDIETHARLVADADVGLIAVNCTAATMLAGADHLRDRLLAATGLASVTTIEAVLAGLRACGAERVVLLTPYPDEVVDAEIEFLAANGVQVVEERHVPCRTPVQQAAIEPSAWLEMATAPPMTHPMAAQAVLLSCAGARVAPVLDEIERAVGVPVVASNQALLWRTLVVLGTSLRVAGYGSLLAGEHD